MTPRKNSGGFRNATGTDLGSGLQALARRVDRAREEGLDTLAVMLVRQIQILLSTPGRGRVYIRSRAAGRKFAIANAGRALRNRRTGQFASARTARGIHRASAPGDPPAVDNNNLRPSITYERVVRTRGFSPRALTGRAGAARRVGTNVEYASALEYGTQDDGGFIAPRPFMRPAVAMVRDAWTHELVGVLRAAGRSIT